MATLLYRLGKNSARHWRLVLAAWLIVLIGIGVVASTMSRPMSNQFTVPGIPSEQAADLQQDLFPGSADALAQATVTIVVAAPEGTTLDEPAPSGAIATMTADLGTITQAPTTPIPGPVEADAALREQLVGIAMATAQATGVNADDAIAQAQANADALSPLSSDRRVGTIEFALDVDSVPDVDPQAREDVLEIIDAARAAGLQVEVTGSAMTGGEDNAGLLIELVGVVIALVILAFTFGSLVAAGLPIVTAGLGVIVGVTGITAMTAFVDLNSSTPLLATMIGLGVGIDYALFILARYRSELEHTEDRAEAMGVAVGTAGSAVVFAGLTVIIALAALSLTGIPFLAAMGWGAASTVLIAVAVALTLLPAVVGVTKSATFGARFRNPTTQRGGDGKVLNHGVRWARLVAKAPVVIVLIAVVGLGSLALPATQMHLAFPSDSTAPTDTSRRQAADLINENFGQGRLAPLLAVVDVRAVPDDQRQAAVQQVAAWASSQDDVVNAQPASINEDGSGAIVLITPAHGPDDTTTETLLNTLRDEQPDIESTTGASIGITGLTAIQTDVSQRLGEALPLYLAVVIGLAFILLTLVFRSLLVPLTATLGFLLSVTATLGATVAIFQEGALGLFPGQPIISFIPLFLIGLVFGLAMDYQVFLVTRIRESYVHGASAREAVVDGFRGSARVVTAAALIMTAVFGGFMFMDDPVIKSMGFALAVAVLFDAFVIRMALIPALMYLLGDKAWWLPRWLDRILPRVDVEGEGLDRPHLAAARAGQSARHETVTTG